MFLSPEACERILVKEWTEYPRPEFLRKVLGMVTGYGLLTVEKDEHRQMRRMMNPAFSLPNLTSQIDKYHDAIDSLLRILTGQIISARNPDQGVVLPMYEWMSKVTLDIICTTAFSYDANSLHDPHNELAFAYEKMLELQSGHNTAWLISLVSIPGFTRFADSRFAWRIRKLLSLNPKLDMLATIIDSMYTIRRISKGMLEEKLRESHTTEMEQERKKDIMSLLVRARRESLENEPSGYTSNDAAMMDQVLTFLGAGHETTASGLAWTLYLLAANKKTQDKLREEVTSLLADVPRPEYRALKELQWLDCVVMESLRVLPPVPMTFRKAAKDDYIDGVLVPAGTILYIPIRVINTWQAIWGPDAEEFRPERWLNLPKSYHSQYSFMSFIVGPHACIGKTMAIIEMKTVLASLIANFEFDLAYEGQIPKPTAAITMKPKDNMPLRIRRVQRKPTA
ncbi:Cytochrome P450 3A29 [Leucoagaricus sp. SymC.cos]|nr:Cytochrome P450 3A29 [Leucoagaricus sp. SymC.cos]